ncbi:MAG TPA: branched-chain-amino-acid transaminase [Phycisphaerae bacterium]|nr:branched-chain-amino-acid transaminase [Phycisphaerae bacterium]HNU46206.1 branched-chain-amino-acid transaminase [Phycisphaerae bacterium]
MAGRLVPVLEANINVFDHGLLYGDGVFEGIRIYGGRIFKEAEHIRRLFDSAKAIRLVVPMTAKEVSEAMYAAMAANGITGDGYIRLVVTRGVGALGISTKRTANPTLFVIADAISLYPKETYERGLHCIVSSYVRNHPNSCSPRVKSLNYLNNILAKAEAQDAGCDEAIMLNVSGRVSECTGDNIFTVRRGELHTPPASEGILEGITRGVVMELARKRGVPVHETLLLRHDLYIADECFATGTAAEVIPITKIEGRIIGDGKAGPITKQLIEDFIVCRTRG